MDEKPDRAAFADVKEYRRAYDRWRDKHRVRARPEGYQRAQYAKHREKRLAEKKVYFQENKERLVKASGAYRKERYHTDPEFRAREIARATANNAVHPEWRQIANERRSERYHAEPERREVVKRANISYVAENADKIRQQRAKFREENRDALAERQQLWRSENLAAAKESVRRYCRAHQEELTARARERRENDPDFAAYLEHYRKQYYKKHKHKFIAHNALREERIQQATPPWITPEQKREMELVYKRAAELTTLTGIRHDVDHVWPIKGKKSCGLHVPWNLQVLPWKENNRKRAREPSDG